MTAPPSSLDQSIWGPHFWFTLHTIAHTYPLHPNDVVKKKYYDFIQNLPLFIPNSEFGNKLSEYLDKFPVTPYLDSRMSFLKWMHFLHNRINIKLGKPIMEFDESLEAYYAQYAPKDTKQFALFREKYKFYMGVFVLLLLLGIGYLYHK